MAIKVVRNEAGNCINFQGSTNPVYWNACLSAEVTSGFPDRINIINDIRTSQSDGIVYEFYQIPYTEFIDASGNSFSSATEAAEHISLIGNVSAPTDLGRGYRGTWNASTNTPDTGLFHENADWYWITVAGNGYDVNDQIRYSSGTASWDRIEYAGGRVQYNVNQVLLNTDTNVYADAVAGKADPSGEEGWYFNNEVAGQKINWYYANNSNTNYEMTSDTVENGWALVKLIKDGPVFFNKYTARKNDGFDRSWYRSKFNYVDNSQFTGRAGQTVLVYFGSDPTTVFPAVTHLQLAYNAGNSDVSVLHSGTDSVYSLALATDGNAAQDSIEVIVKNVGFKNGDYNTNYSLQAQLDTTEMQSELDAINSSALNSYDIYVKSGYNGNIKTGSTMQPFDNIASGIAAASDGDRLFLEGTFTIDQTMTIPSGKSLYFYGEEGTIIQYSSYSNSHTSGMFKATESHGKELTFANIEFKNAGGYAVDVSGATSVIVDNCVIHGNGWSQTGIDFINSESGSILGYDSTTGDLTNFYTNECSNGGGVKLQDVVKVEVTDCQIYRNNNPVKMIDCGFIGDTEGYGYIARNQIYKNIGIGIELDSSESDGSAGCRNFIVYNNAIKEHGNDGLKILGGYENTVSLGSLKNNWCAGLELDSVSNTRIREMDLSDNNRSAVRADGTNSDGLASLQVEGSYLDPLATFIVELMSVQIHNTNIGSNTTRCGLILKENMENHSSAHSLVNINDLGFINQDYGIDIEADLSNTLFVSIGDCTFIDSTIKNIRHQGQGYYHEIPFSNHTTNIPNVDISVDSTAQSILIKDGQNGEVINRYHINQLQAIPESDGTISIIEKNSNRVQISSLNPGYVYVNGVLSPGNVNDVINAMNSEFTQNAAIGPQGSSTPIVNAVGTLITPNQSSYIFDPVGDADYASSVAFSSSSGNDGAIWTNETIDQVGEYYTFDIQGEGVIGFGIYDLSASGTNSVGDIDHIGEGTGNHNTGLRWSLWFSTTANGPSSVYGEFQGHSIQEGWTSSNLDRRFSTSVEGNTWVSGDPVTIKVGINDQGYAHVAYYHRDLDEYITMARTSYLLPEGDYGLAIKWKDLTPKVYQPRIHTAADNALVVEELADSNISLFGEAQGSLASGVIVPNGTGSSDGFVTSGCIGQNAGEFFQVSGLTQFSTIGLVDDSAVDISSMVADFNANDYDLSVSGLGKYYYSAMRILDNMASFTRRDLDLSPNLSYNYGPAHSSSDFEAWRVGFDLNGKLAYWGYDGSGNWNRAATSTSNIPTGCYKFMWKGYSGTNVEIETVTTGILSPTVLLNWRYIESPDGEFYYPLYSSTAEAEEADRNITSLLTGVAGLTNGSGTYDTFVFVDDSTNTTWYSPSSASQQAVSFSPTSTTGSLSGWNPSTITWTEIVTEADTLHVPSPLNVSDYTFAENVAVNIQLVPADYTNTVTVTNLPSELSFNGQYIIGTTRYVPENTTDTITVTLSNAFGSTTENFDINITDNASLSTLADITTTYGNTIQPNRIKLTHDFIGQYDFVLSTGSEIRYSYGAGANPPTIGILSSAGTGNLAAFDPASGTLGVGSYDFATVGQWDLRYVTFGGYIGGNNKYQLVGWSDNTTQAGSEGDNHNVEFKLVYDTGGYISLYRDGILKLTSASTFSGDQTITFAGFDNQSQTDVYIPSNFVIVNSNFGSTTPPSGFVDPLLEGEMSTATVLGTGQDAAVQFTDTLGINFRYIFPQTWTESNILPYITADNEDVFIGVPTSGVSWTDVGSFDFDANFNLERTSNPSNHRSKIRVASSSSYDTVAVNSTTDAYYDYALEWDGDDLHVIACNVNDINTQPGINNGGSFSRTVTESSYAGTGSLDVVLGVDGGGKANLSTAGLSKIRIPFGPRDILVGEGSAGNGQFALQPDAYHFDHLTQHSSVGSYAGITSLDAGQTYRFIYDPSMEAGDFIEFRLASDGTTVYTSGITTFDNTSNGDPHRTEGYKGVNFAVPSDAPPLNLYFYNSFSSSYDAGRPISIAGSTYTAPVSGVTQEGPAANQTSSNLFDAGDYGWLSVDNQLGAGERLVMDTAFLADLVDAMPDGSFVKIGLKDTGWTNTTADTNFEGALRFVIERNSSTDVDLRAWSGNSSTNLITTTVAGITSNNVEAFLEVTGSGNNIRFGIKSDTTNSTNATSSTVYANWDSSYKVQTGNQGYGITSIDIMILGKDLTAGAAMDTADVDWTGLSEISIPAATTSTTSWAKALDFSGSSERAQMVSSSSNYVAMKMAGTNNQVSAPSSGQTTSAGHPWATVVVFSADGNSSNQHIWNMGEGAGSTDDNIYLRLDASRNLYFGIGRTGDYNECKIMPTHVGSSWTLTAGNWYGIYVGHNGTRYGTGNTASQMAAAFDIRLMGSSDSFSSLTSNLSVTPQSNGQGWNNVGGRMNRAYDGDMTIGGRGSNRNFHGKVASFVATTLKNSDTMPGTAEIEMMITDPMKWLQDYKQGNSYRRPSQTTNTTNFQVGNSSGFEFEATQVWLMGDGTNDSYSNMIRNQVLNTDQNYTKLNLISMVSNDIETVSISGLT